MYGLVICPPLMTIYAAFQLAEYNRLRAEYDFPIDWRARLAKAANLLVLILCAIVFVGIVISSTYD